MDQMSKMHENDGFVKSPFGPIFVILAKLVLAKAGSGNPGYLKEAWLPKITRYFI